MELPKEARKMTLDDFVSFEPSREVAELAGRFNGGAFMTCHTAIFAQTGIWIEELVPVFQKLDAHLAVNAERVVAAVS